MTTCTVRAPAAAAALALILGAGAAGATDWCGENGLVRFSFVAGDSLVSSLEAAPQGGVTTVEVWAWLTDVAPVSRDGEAFLAVGGFELNLEISGAEAYVLEQEFPTKAVNIGRATGSIVAGLDPGLRLRDGRTQLVRWKVMFQGAVSDVVFGLDPEGLISCATAAGCPESGTQALYIGVDASRQLTSLFGAGYVPAVLNPSGAVSLEPVRGNSSFQDVGIYQRR